MLEELQKILIKRLLEERHKMTRQECEDYPTLAFEIVYHEGKLAGKEEME